MDCVPANIAPQYTIEVIIIRKSNAIMPTIIKTPIFRRAISCNFLAIAVVVLALLKTASCAVFVAAFLCLALRYSRLIRCFCSLFCNAFFFICGFSSINFWYWKFTSFLNCFFSSPAIFFLCLYSFPLYCLRINANKSSPRCSVL